MSRLYLPNLGGFFFSAHYSYSVYYGFSVLSRVKRVKTSEPYTCDTADNVYIEKPWNIPSRITSLSANRLDTAWYGVQPGG